MVDHKDVVASNPRRLRRANGWTQDELAERVGLSDTLHNGSHSAPQPDILLGAGSHVVAAGSQRTFFWRLTS